MNDTGLSLLAFAGGVFLALQGSLNARLGVYLKNPLTASLIAFGFSTLFALLFMVITSQKIPTSLQAKEVPVYLWFSGGLFSVLGISLYYFTIPKLGMAQMISLGLCGQVIFSIVASHFGWFGFPEQTIDFKRIIGVISMIIGISLINYK